VFRKPKRSIRHKINPRGNGFYPGGGTTTIGSNNGQPNEQPVFEVNVTSFFMDKNLVTVDEFRIFVEETGYLTEAEKFGNGLVFDFDRGEWALA